MAAESAEAHVEGNGPDLVVFGLDDQRYALALACVQRSIRVVAITPLPGAPAIVLGVIDLGGVVIPVIDIRGRGEGPTFSLELPAADEGILS
jgi:purine-binding chemotaxis protein CheW